MISPDCQTAMKLLGIKPLMRGIAMHDAIYGAMHSVRVNGRELSEGESVSLNHGEVLTRGLIEFKLKMSSEKKV